MSDREYGEDDYVADANISNPFGNIPSQSHEGENRNNFIDRVEAQFAINKITTEETKFNYFVAQLEPKYVENIWDIIQSGSPNKYSAAKERLINIFKESEEKKIKRLVSELELGSDRPSQLLRKMKSYAGAEITEKVLKTLWMNKLPSNVRSILVISNENLEKLAEMADKIVEMSPHSSIYSVSAQDQQDRSLSKEVAELPRMIEAMQTLNN